MSLRDALRRAVERQLHVASPSTCNTQLGTPSRATDHATPVQAGGGLPRRAHATGDATPVQLQRHDRATCTSETRQLHVACPRGCNTQLPLPRMTAKQADACHSPCWDDTEIATFTRRVVLFVQRGLLPGRADALAERLVLRDREQDTRRHCAECMHWRRTGCHAGGPVDVLMRCGAFEEMPHDRH